MDSILEAVELAAAALVFCIAVYFFMMLSKDVDTFTHETFKDQKEIESCLLSEF